MSSALYRVSRRSLTTMGAVLAAAAVMTSVGSAGPASAQPQDSIPVITGLFSQLGEQLGGAQNTAWGTDPRTGQVVLTVADAAQSTLRSRLTDLADELGSKVRVEHIPGALTTQIATSAHNALNYDDALYGGDRLASNDRVCTAGFNVARGGEKYVVTAGHCTSGGPGFNGVGPSVDSKFPGNDYGLVRNDESRAVGGVNRYDGTWQRITSVGRAYNGERVCKSGQTSGTTCGEVTAVNQTVNYGDGRVVHNLIKTRLSADSGDSGAPLFDGSTALGTLSGGNGSTEFFQPLSAAMRAYQLDLIR